MLTSPALDKQEEDPMISKPASRLKQSDSITKNLKKGAQYSTNVGQPMTKSKSGVKKANERLAKERALKAEYIPADSLLPSGIKDIDELKKIRESQKKKKTMPRPNPIKFEGKEVRIVTMIVSPGCKSIIVGTEEGSIIAYNIHQNKISFRSDDPDAGFINCLTFGGKKNCYLIASCDEGFIKIFDWKAKLEKHHLIKREDSFEFHYSTDLYLAAANSENEICLFSLSDDDIKPKPLPTFKDEYEVLISAVAIDKENTRLFSCGDFHIKIHDILTYELLHKFEDAHEDYLNTITLSADSLWLVSGSDDSSIKVWDLVEREELYHLEHAHSDNIKSVAISSDKKFVISCCEKGSVKVHNLEEGLAVHRIHTQNGDASMALASNQQWIATAAGDEVNFWDFEHGKQFSKDKTHKPKEFNGENYCCPNSKFFVSWNSHSQTLKVCDVESGEAIDLTGKIPFEYNSYIRVSPNGEFVVSYYCNQEADVVIYYHRQDKTVKIYVEDDINSLTISPDSQSLIYATYDSIKFLDLDNQKESRVIEKISEYQLEKIRVSPNGEYLILCSTDRSIMHLDLKSEEVFRFKNAHDNKINQIAISFDSKFFVSASQDHTIKVFDVQSKQLIHKFVDVDDCAAHSVCVSPDNRYVVTGYLDIKFYDLETKSHVHTIENSSKKNGYTIIDLAISPNGRALFTSPSKNWTGTPQIYRLDGANNLVMDDKIHPPPGEQDMISYSYFKAYYTKFNSIEESLLRSNESKAEIFAKIIKSNFYVMPYSWNILHIVSIDSNDTFIKDMPAYADFKISFLLDRYGKTPLHYLVAQEKITYSSVNIMLTYICDYLDDCADERKYEYQQIVKSLNPLCWFILLKCDIKLRERFLNLCFVDSPTPFKIELPVFGEPTSNSAYFSQIPEITPQIKETLCEEGQNQISFKTNLLYLDYDVTSEDMGKTIECLIEQDSDDLFRSQLVSKLLDHLWSQAKPTLLFLFAVFSAFMICLSVYIALQERILAFEIVILVIAGLMLVGETLQMITAQLDYVTDPWNVLDIIQLLMTVAFIITRFTDDENELARSWMSTVIILAGYFRWVSYLRVFKPIRNFMQIFGTAVKDMFSFLVIIGLIVIGFSIVFVAFGIGNASATEWGPYGAYLYNAYSGFYGTIGDPDYGTYDLSQKILIAVIAFLLNVILLNLLISILGESYGNSVATRDKTETLTKFEMILEAVTFMKFLRRRRMASISRKSYLVYCFSLQSEESKGNPEGEMEIRINKKFADLKESLESQFDENKASEEKLEKLNAQIAHLKEFYLRTKGFSEYADLKKKYKDVQRLEKKIENDIQNEEDYEIEDNDGDKREPEEEDGKKNEIRIMNSQKSKFNNDADGYGDGEADE